MKHFLLGGLAALVMMAVGLFWWQGRAEVERRAPPAGAVRPMGPVPLPTANVGKLRGPAPPEATELSREQRRFNRYDRDHDNRISRNEMLSTRADAFRKLDKDGNNLLTFEEWAGATVNKFDRADGNHDQYLTRAEFLTTAPVHKPKPACVCEKDARTAAKSRKHASDADGDDYEDDGEGN